MIKKTILLFLTFFFVGFIYTYTKTRVDATFVNPRVEKNDIVHAVTVWWYQRKLGHCYEKASGIEAFNCANALLRHMAQRYGARTSLDAIEPLTPKYQPLMANSHNLAHTIGDFAVLQVHGKEGQVPPDEKNIIENLGKALVECDGWGSFGCYHGVVEAGLSRIDPGDRARVVRKACIENPLVTSKQYYVNQCMHWFGHGMAIFTDQTLLETLAMCEGVDPDFESDAVQLCLSGVFHAGALPGTSDDSYLANVRRVYDPDDVYYPCLDIPERFRGHCHSHVPGRSNTADPALVLANCNRIPEPDAVKRLRYIKVCYESTGNNLMDSTENNIEGIIRICQNNALPGLLGICLTGPARYSTLRDPLLTNTFSFDLCKTAPEEAKHACYAAIGFGNFENYKSLVILERFCQKAEPAYRSACMNISYE